MDSPIKHIVSISGGKDSLATALVALETCPPESVGLVFADTGNEHPLTLEYLDYLRGKLGRPIEVVAADFAPAMRRRKDYILNNWAGEGIDDARIAAAVALMDAPTGVPFLDLALLKGRFPSGRARFCTTELKVFPITNHLLEFAEAGYWVWSWQGVRADESAARRYLHEWEDVGAGIGKYRPILRWTVADVFAAAAAKGIKPNPLYQAGMTRVGCMPCIYSRKSELREIARRWPEVIDRLRRWEAVVSASSKRGYSSFFIPQERRQKLAARDFFAVANIDAKLRWAKTAPGGRQHDLLFHLDDAGDAGCSSVYGLCE